MQLEIYMVLKKDGCFYEVGLEGPCARSPNF